MNWNNGHLSDISDIFRTFIGHTTKAQNLSPKETLVNSKYKKLQINADKCRYLIVTYFIKSTHRKAREERKAKVVFQIGLIGSTGCVLSYDRVYSVSMSKINKPQIPSRASEGRRHVCPAGIHGFPLPKGNRDAYKRRFVNLASATLGFFFREQSEGYEKPSN